MERISFSPGEFAALFGKSQTWGYRQIYAGKVKAITEYGRIQIPASEVERILSTAGRYEGMPKKKPKSKAELELIKPELQSAWQVFVQGKRRGAQPGVAKVVEMPAHSVNAREAALRRLARGKK